MMILKKILSARLKLYLKYLLSKKTELYKDIDKQDKKIIIALAADYGNLGDVAITYAQTKYLEQKFPGYKLIDFPISKTFTEMKSLKSVCTEKDIITIVGGGNTSDLYEDIEYCRQFIIQNFPNNRIISFPQTVDFSNTYKGKKLQEESIRIYSKHRDLTLSAREENSYIKYRDKFINKVKYTPDIVLYLNEELPVYKRQGITLCLRNDKEKSFNNFEQEALINRLSEIYDISYNDTHINKSNLSIKERENELKQIWTKFKKSKVVLTDRLHGMIFCAITRTPCVAIDNSNHKISGVYSAWLKDVKFIKLIKSYDVEKICKKIEDLYDINIEGNISSLNLNDKFNELISN